MMALSPAGFLGSWSLVATRDVGQRRVGANLNYRGQVSNKYEESDTECAQTLAAGPDFPSGCRVKSFTTLDMSDAYRLGPNTEVFGSIANVLDAKPRSDFLTYGAIGYNAQDSSGAIGRYFRVGLKALVLIACHHRLRHFAPA
jgi:iron complex outermembrane receptor protein